MVALFLCCHLQALNQALQVLAATAEAFKRHEDFALAIVELEQRVDGCVCERQPSVARCAVALTLVGSSVVQGCCRCTGCGADASLAQAVAALLAYARRVAVCIAVDGAYI